MDEIPVENLHLAETTENDLVSRETEQQLLQLKTILANSSYHIDGIPSKSADSDDFILEELMACSFWSKQDQSNLCDSDFACKEEDGRISLAYERLQGIPRKIAEKFALRTHTLDLSYNSIKDLTFLSNFKILHTLILDNNVALNEKTLPFLPSLRILWLNKCEICQLPKWVQRINICTPNIRQLSLMGNPGVRSSFNGGSTLENNDYMMYVIGSLPKLDYLDDVKITDCQRKMARAHTRLLAWNGASINFGENYSSGTSMMTILKHDAKAGRRYGKLVPKQNGSKFDRL
ncbi:leucine-rich melanocyte differentiation-associated protein-like [Sitodiplosis mosellana]|uniref:leucine-rich melanocyte differentiation-associated protein-like n=1 Tax=Sitodiplosis mosellana TaxID=263140 RepID=UPI002444BC4E|nr:leucine-rich melanocyte differentiation-associated protein-like [Sitodiplosis mosellana]